MEENQWPLESRPDLVNHPSHYNVNGLPECIEVIEKLGLNYHCGCILKYLWRAGRKDPTRVLEDLSKARWYLTRYIELLEKQV